MDKQAREAFNASFSAEKYERFIASIENTFPRTLDFRVAETPVFVPKELKAKMLSASDEIISVLRSPNFIEETTRAIPKSQCVPNENSHSSFLAIDFAICLDADGNLEPQLIELQGFPSIFAYQGIVSEKFIEHFSISRRFNYLFGPRSLDGYVEKLKSLIVGRHDPDQVVLLEIFPEQQKTRIDFAATEEMLGVKAVCYTEVIKEGKKLFYKKDGIKIQIRRIYNRLIFDDLLNYPDLESSFHFTDDVDVEWVGHPNWFFRISKFCLPLLKSKFVPDTRFLSEYDGIFPPDLENYVLKPLFSFAGSGVELHVDQEMLRNIPHPANYILQKKVVYQPVIQAPDGLVKCEIRLMFGWEDHQEKPELLIALSRLSRGEMIGVRFNKDFTWVGGSATFFENTI
jgi:hypothetical protein